MRIDDQSAEFDASDPTILVIPSQGAHHQREGRRWPNALDGIDELLAITREAEVLCGDDGLNYAWVSHECGHTTWAIAPQDFAGTLRLPVILTGIPDLVRRLDLADRSLRIRLAPINAVARRTDADIRAALNLYHPRLLDALLDAAVVGLRRPPEVAGPQRGVRRLHCASDQVELSDSVDCPDRSAPGGTKTVGLLDIIDYKRNSVGPSIGQSNTHPCGTRVFCF